MSSPQHALALKNLLNYLADQGRSLDLKAFNLSGSAFCRGARGLADLPGVSLNLLPPAAAEEGKRDVHTSGEAVEHAALASAVWLRVAKPTLREAPLPPPPPEEWAAYWQVPADPNILPTLNEALLEDELSSLHGPWRAEENFEFIAQTSYARVENALEAYLPLWLEWAQARSALPLQLGQEQRFHLYQALLEIRQQMRYEQAVESVELVWGIGIASWQLPLVEGGYAPYQYPLLTLAMDLLLDPDDLALELRPRGEAWQLELDALSLCHLPGLPEAEKTARALLRGMRELDDSTPISPFDPTSSHPLLHLLATLLDPGRGGDYPNPDRQPDGLPTIGPQLRISADWVVFVRRRGGHARLDDLARLGALLTEEAVIPAAVRALVAPPGSVSLADDLELSTHHAESAVPASSMGDAAGEAAGLYFPLPYNAEQLLILQRLARLPGVVVQGPPGTGKSHTIANMVCHALAEGKRVLVSSAGDAALCVLQAMIPAPLRVLTVAYLDGGSAGNLHLQQTIEHLHHRLSQIDPVLAAEKVARLSEQRTRTRARLAALEEELAARMVEHLRQLPTGLPEAMGAEKNAMQIATWLAERQQQHGWLADAPERTQDFPLTEVEVEQLRIARRALGIWIAHHDAVLPKLETLPTPEQICEIHEALLFEQRYLYALEQNQLKSPCGATPDRQASCHMLSHEIERALPLIDQLIASSDWAQPLRVRLRLPDVRIERQAMENLLGELDTLERLHAEFLKRPVWILPDLLNDPRLRGALTKAIQTGKPWAWYSWVSLELKNRLASVTVGGHPPRNESDWLHIHRYVHLHDIFTTFCVRWNVLASLFGLPYLRHHMQDDNRGEIIHLAQLAQRAYALGQNFDLRFTEMYMRLFAVAPPSGLLDQPEQLRALGKELAEHQRHYALGRTLERLNQLRQALLEASGTLSDRLRIVLAEHVGNPEIGLATLREDYTPLYHMLLRLHALAPHFATLRQGSQKIAAAGAPLWARALTQGETEADIPLDEAVHALPEPDLRAATEQETTDRALRASADTGTAATALSTDAGHAEIDFPEVDHSGAHTSTDIQQADKPVPPPRAPQQKNSPLLQGVSGGLDEPSAASLASAAQQNRPDGERDPQLPEDWQEAWRWAQLRGHLDRLLQGPTLAQRLVEHRDLALSCAQQTHALVEESAWLRLQQQATPAMHAALVAYSQAVFRLGQNQDIHARGVHALHYRRQAQQALREAAQLIPCWIMNHDSVCEVLPARLGDFDWVIIDEASQSTLWALPALLRGKQFLIVGDQKQVSPNPGLVPRYKLEQLKARWLEDHPMRDAFTTDLSLYELALRAFPQEQVMLREHFRSIPPLIGFSNHQFYLDQIRPLRLPLRAERLDTPLVDIHVQGGMRDTHGVNRAEALVIAEEVAAILADPAMIARTLGVVTLLGGEAQAEEITRLVRARCPMAELERRQFLCGSPALFQGSERDLVLLSLVASPGQAHALAGRVHEQRFNVAASRARDRLYLVRSLGYDELSGRDGLRRTLLAWFSAPTAHAAFPSPLTSDDVPPSACEIAIVGALRQHGYRVWVRYPEAPHDPLWARLMVVEGTHMRLALACEGEDETRDWQETLQQQQTLERAGWQVWRCYAAEWYHNPDRTLADLRARLADLGIDPLPMEAPAPMPWVDCRTVRIVGNTVTVNEQRTLTLLDLETRISADPPEPTVVESAPAGERSEISAAVPALAEPLASAEVASAVAPTPEAALTDLAVAEPASEAEAAIPDLAATELLPTVARAAISEAAVTGSVSTELPASAEAPQDRLATAPIPEAAEPERTAAHSAPTAEIPEAAAVEPASTEPPDSAEAAQDASAAAPAADAAVLDLAPASVHVSGKPLPEAEQPPLSLNLPASVVLAAGASDVPDFNLDWNIPPVPPPQAQQDAYARMVLEALGSEPMTAPELRERLQQDMGEVLAALLTLERSQHIIRLQEGRYQVHSAA